MTSQEALKEAAVFRSKTASLTEGLKPLSAQGPAGLQSGDRKEPWPSSPLPSIDREAQGLASGGEDTLPLLCAAGSLGPWLHLFYPEQWVQTLSDLVPYAIPELHRYQNNPLRTNSSSHSSAYNCAFNSASDKTSTSVHPQNNALSTIFRVSVGQGGAGGQVPTYYLFL